MVLKDTAILPAECEQWERLVDALLEVYSTEVMVSEARDKSAV